MKLRPILALVGLAISFASPSFAQQSNTPPAGRQATNKLKKPREQTMKMRLVVALVGLAISFAVPCYTEHFTVGRPSQKTMQNAPSSDTKATTMSLRSIG